MERCDFEQPLNAFVEALRGDISNPYLTATLETKLATGEITGRYLEAIGKDNSYTRLGRLIQRSPISPPSPSDNEDRSKSTRGIDIVARARQMTRDIYIKARLSEFETVREVIYDGIKGMFADPMFITDKKFGHLVSLIEQSKSASVEMHLHFGNAFVQAWDRIPRMALELAIKPGDSIKVSRADSETEMRRARSLSRGMSM
jgi:hypothetical protein